MILICASSDVHDAHTAGLVKAKSSMVSRMTVVGLDIIDEPKV